MPHQTLIPWGRKLTILAALIALVATMFGTPPLTRERSKNEATNPAQSGPGTPAR